MEAETGRQESRPLSPFLTIWYRPRHTIRFIIDHNPKYLVLPLAMAYGFLFVFGLSFNRGYSWVGVAVFSLVGGPIIGIILLYVSAAIYRWLGQTYFDGKASALEARAAAAWSEFPMMVKMFITYFVLVLIGRDYYVTNVLPQINASPIFRSFELLWNFGTAIYSYFIQASCFGEVHQFSTWKGFLTVFLPLIAYLLILGLCIIGGLLAGG